MTILFNRSLVLAGIEAVFRVPETLAVGDDAILVAEPNFAADVTVLDRNNASTSLSVDPGAAGRKIATVTFAHEIRASGATDGVGGGEPAVDVLLRACGMLATAIPAGTGTIIDDKFTNINHVNDMPYTKTGGLHRSVAAGYSTGSDHPRGNGSGHGSGRLSRRRWSGRNRPRPSGHQ